MKIGDRIRIVSDSKYAGRTGEIVADDPTYIIFLDGSDGLVIGCGSKYLEVVKDEKE